MAALVHELVNMASDPSVSVADLLRRAMVAASRLDLVEVTTWLTDELNGYENREVPPYRRLRAEVMCKNPYHGLIPLLLPPGTVEVLSESPVGQSVPELEALLGGSGTCISRFPYEIERQLMQDMEVALQPFLVISEIKLKGIIETVRSRVLAWSLHLERQGIIGEGMTFTSREKEMSKESNTQYNITAHGGQIQIASNGSSQTMQTTAIDQQSLSRLIEGLSTAIAKTGASGEHIDELRAEIATLRAQQESPKPKGGVIREAAKSIKAILEGAGANVLAELAKPQVIALFALAGT